MHRGFDYIVEMSIAIPTWEANGKGAKFLENLLRTIDRQTFRAFEVCISDHSKNDEIFNVIKRFRARFEIIYHRNENMRGNSPANANRSIEMCSGDIIKVMFQDALFYDNQALGKIHSALSCSHQAWLVSGCNHTKNDGWSYYNEMYPKWTNDIINGVNTISSPSVLSMKKEVFDKVQFDTKLAMMMDCEFYYNVKENFGEPICYREVLITNRVHQNQISQRFYNDDCYLEKVKQEVFYCKQKHKL